MSQRGFILQPTYRIESGRPVVHLYGRLESGETFLVRDGRETPHFYIPATQADKARSLGANAVVGLEVTLDPFARSAENEATGLRLHAVGTAAKLEPLF